MIKFIHQNKQIVGIVFLVIAICFAVAGVGIDGLHTGANPNREAITINDEKLSVDDVARSERNIELRYRQMFGDQFAQVASSLNLNIRQQAIDSLVDRTILDQEAQRQGFAASDDKIREYILTNIFKGDNGENTFSQESYRNLLQNIGMSAPQFEQELKDEISRNTLVNLLRDVAVVTSKDAETRLLKQKTKYAVVAATISQADLARNVPTPSETDLKKYYESHATEYELPAQVSYSYYPLVPTDFEKDVQVAPQDIEFYYSENISKFTTPEQSRVRSIKLLYPKENDPTKMAAVRERANAARNEALAGKSFDDLVAQYSDDLPSKILKGDLGWIKKGDKSPSFDAALAKTSAGSVSELIEEDFGFEIIKVEEKKASQARPLNEVRAQVEQEIRTQEAPAYAANYGRELLMQAKKSGQSLTELLPSGKSIKDSGGLISQTKDPEASLSGLTQKVFMLPTTERVQPSLIELGDTSVIVQVREFKEPTTPPFEQVKEKVTAAYNATETRKLAETRANELLKAAQANPATFTTEASQRSAKLVGPFEISREEPSSEKFPTLTPQMRNAILSVETPNTVVSKVFSGGADFTVIKVDGIVAPSLSDPKNAAALDEYRNQAAQELAQSTIRGTMEMLKGRASIEIRPDLMTN